MKSLTYEEARSHPLTTDALVEERVTALIGRACRHQLWFLFLDENLVQLPVMIPLDDLPSAPDDSVHGLARGLARAMEAAGAHSVVVVIERYASSVLSVSDIAWSRAIDEALTLNQIELRGLLLSHNRGVRWIAPDDYRF